MQYPKANISIFVIFVLLASSLLGLLTLLSVQKLLTYQSVTLGYHQSYYNAKAGLELALVLQKLRGIGFSYTLSPTIFNENFACGYDCHVQAEIISRSSFIQDNYWLANDCTSGFVLGTGQTKIIPLFYDNITGSVYDVMTQAKTYNSVYQYFNAFTIDPTTRETSKNIVIGMFVLSGDTLLPGGSFLRVYTGNVQQLLPWFANIYQGYVANNPIVADVSLHRYLLLANQDPYIPLEICFQTKGLHNHVITLGQDVVFVYSVGSFAGYRVGLQAILDASMPQYLLQTYSDL